MHPLNICTCENFRFLVMCCVMAALFQSVVSQPSISGIKQPCKTGGAIKFGIPWPKSVHPLDRLEVGVDGASRNVELAASAAVINVVDAQSPTAQSSGTKSESCTTTNVDSLPWWRVDLGEIRDVHSIQITNKGSCCDADVTNLRVYVNDVRGPTSDPLSVSPSQHSFAFDSNTECGSVSLNK